MEYAFPKAWGGRRGFWTRRRRTATSLLAVVGLIAGIAVAYKLFDQTVPNNIVRDASKFDFQVHVQRSPAQCTQTVPNDTQWCVAGPSNAIYRAGIDQFPGDSRTEQVRIRNTNSTPARDASFEMYVNQSTITVRGCVTPSPVTGVCTSTPVIPNTDPNWSTFVNYWTLEVTKERYINLPIDEFPDGRGDSSAYVPACEGLLTAISSQSPCKLGLVRAAGTSSDLTEERLDQRYYEYVLTEDDPGVDQSAYKGWTISFDFVYNARVPAEPDAETLIFRQ